MEENEKLKLLTIEEMCDILQVGRNCAYTFSVVSVEA